MNKIKILFLLTAALLSPLDIFLFYPTSSFAGAGVLQETKIDKDNDGKADFIILERQDADSKTTTTLSIQNYKIQNISFKKHMGNLTAIVSYGLAKGQYELNYSYATRDKVFFEESLFSDDLEGIPCADCNDPKIPQGNILNVIGGIKTLTGVIEKDAIAALKEKFPLDNTCKVPGPFNGRHPEINFENEIYKSILELTSDQDLIECLTGATKDTLPEVGAKFQGLPESLYQTQAPLRPIAMQCATNFDDCKCTKDKPEECLKQPACLLRANKKKVVGSEGEEKLELCENGEQGCDSYITRGAFVEGKGIRSIILSNSLRMKDRGVVSPGYNNALQKKKDKLKETIAHELIHAFGCPGEEETQYLIKKCIINRDYGGDHTAKPLLRPKKKSGDVPTIKLDITSERPNLDLKAEDLRVDFSEEIAPARLRSSNPLASQDVAAERTASALPRTAQDTEINNNAGISLPSRLEGRPVTVSSSDVYVGGRTTTRIIPPKEENTSYRKEVAAIEEKVFSGLRTVAKAIALPEAQAQTKPIVSNVKVKYTPKPKADANPVDFKVDTPQASSATFVGNSNEDVVLPKPESGVSSGEEIGSTAVINNTTIYNNTTVQGSSSTGGQKSDNAGSRKPAAVSAPAIATLSKFVDSKEGTLSGNNYYLVKDAITNPEVIKWLEAAGIEIYFPGRQGRQRYGSTKPKTTLMDKKDRFTKSGK